MMKTSLLGATCLAVSALCATDRVTHVQPQAHLHTAHIRDATNAHVNTTTPTGTVSAPTASPTIEPYTLGMKTLVLHAGQDERMLPKVVLGGFATQYDLIDVWAGQEPDLSTPQYHSIVVTSNRVGMTAAREYAQKYNVRIVCLYCPITSKNLGVTVGAPVGYTVSFDQAAIDNGVSDVVNTQTKWQLDDDLQAVGFSINGNATPVMRYGGSGVAAFAGLNAQTGAEEMHFGFRAAASDLCSSAWCIPELPPNTPSKGEYTKLNLALGHVWFTWVTKGLYLGHRHMFLQVHIDDVFIANVLKTPNFTMYRITPDDLKQAVQWSRSAPSRHDLAPGSEIRLELAFNGVGYSAAQYPPGLAFNKSGTDNGALGRAAEQNILEFNWVSHTWTHPNLDWASPDECNGSLFTCTRTYERILDELRFNQMFANGDGVPAYGGPGAEFFFS
eukprot:comp22312_c0_seq1/m.33140 comp22312_c0_seq1/g.33140  ORF comp22312_c0_seq1/g.33140 comp22312_c0_seq1/m.33140 type:complete len:444 (-) comp22312_c0_seq1:33-1364(-)